MSNLVVLLHPYEPLDSDPGEEDSILVIRGPIFGSICMRPQKKGYWTQDHSCSPFKEIATIIQDLRLAVWLVDGVSGANLDNLKGARNLRIGGNINVGHRKAQRKPS